MTLQQVREHGWNEDMLRRAIAAISAAIKGSQLEEEDCAVASELVRCLQYGVDMDARGIVGALQGCKPQSPHTPQWDPIYAFLLGPTGFASVIQIRCRP
jgi:hypothetical protein